MTTTIKRLVSGSALTGGAATYYTAQPLTRARITAATLTNTTGAPIQATVYLVPSGGVAGAANTVISTKTIAPGETYHCPELVNQVIEPSGTIQALGNGLTFVVSGVEIV
jgi:hypothetical protein